MFFCTLINNKAILEILWFVKPNFLVYCWHTNPQPVNVTDQSNWKIIYYRDLLANEVDRYSSKMRNTANKYDE